MPGGKSLLVIGAGADLTRTSIVEESLSFWPAESRPPVSRVTLAEVLADKSTLDHCGAAWVVLDEICTPEAYELIGQFQDYHVPNMISRVGESIPIGAPWQSGSVAAPLDAPPQALCGILRTLWSQGGIIRALLVENKLLLEHQGGLCGQIDKIDEELRLAAQLQREFLPSSLPDVGCVEFRVLYRPAGYVSGDVYDVVRLDEHHVGFFVADAVGHGVPAALMTLFIKRCLHTKEIDRTQPAGYRIVPPNEALARLNHDMIAHQQVGKARLATACYGVLNCKTLELTFARAGHPYPMILRADGTHEWIQPDGAMLGIFEEEDFALAKLKLEPGDRLLLYSDGFEVAFPDVSPQHAHHGRVANNQYEDEFKTFANGSLDLAFERLAGRLDEQTGSLHQRDDLTVVCVGIQHPKKRDAARPSEESVPLGSAI